MQVQLADERAGSRVQKAEWWKWVGHWDWREFFTNVFSARCWVSWRPGGWRHVKQPAHIRTAYGAVYSRIYTTGTRTYTQQDVLRKHGPRKPGSTCTYFYRLHSSSAPVAVLFPCLTVHESAILVLRERWVKSLPFHFLLLQTLTGFSFV